MVRLIKSSKLKLTKFGHQRSIANKHYKFGKNLVFTNFKIISWLCASISAVCFSKLYGKFGFHKDSPWLDQVQISFSSSNFMRILCWMHNILKLDPVIDMILHISYGFCWILQKFFSADISNPWWLMFGHNRQHLYYKALQNTAFWSIQ